MEDLRTKGLAPPKEKTRPDVEPYEDLIWVWNGFWRLSHSRPVISMVGPGRLLISEILAFCTIQGWGSDKQRDFLYYVDAMDGKYMELVGEEQDKERKKREQEQQRNKNKIPQRR